MRDQVAAARGLPLQAIAEPGGIEGEQQQVLLAGIVLGQGLSHLVAGREMNEAVAEIVASP